MATKTFVSGNWNGGVWSPVGDPTAADDVKLTNTSGACVINTTAAARSLDCTGYTNTLTRNAVLVLGDGTAGAGNVILKLVSGMTLAGTGSIQLRSTSGTQQTITTAGKTLSAFNPGGAGSSYLLADNLTMTGTFSYSEGTFDTGNKTISCGFLSITGPNFKTLTLGSSAITATSVTITPLVNFTLNAGTSSITTSGTFTGGGYTYYDLTLTSTGSMSVIGANTFHNLTRTASSATATLTLNDDQIVTSTFTVTGTKTSRILVNSDTLGVARTITAAVVTANGCDFRDITGAGAASWNMSAATDYTGDCGGNTMKALGTAAFTSATTQTSTGTASFSFSTHTFTTRYPLPQDTVVISNAFIAGRTVTINVPRVGNISCATCTGSPIIALSSTTSYFGSVDFTGASSVTGSSTITFEGRSNSTFNSAGFTYGRTINISVPGSKLTLAGDLTANSIALAYGEIDHDGYNVNLASNYNFTGSTDTRICTLGSGLVRLTRASSTVWTISSASNLTINATGSEIEITDTSNTTKTFQGGGFTYGKLTVSGNGVWVQGSNTFAELAVNNAGNTHNPSGLTVNNLQIQTVGTLTTNGSAGNLAKIQSQSASPDQGIINKASPGDLVTDYIEIYQVAFTSTSGQKWFAGVNAVDSGGNDNIIFSGVPTGSPMYYYRQMASLAISLLILFL